jgi:hypothetical protein
VDHARRQHRAENEAQDAEREQQPEEGLHLIGVRMRPGVGTWTRVTADAGALDGARTESTTSRT